jgi:hypothetical protein
MRCLLLVARLSSHRTQHSGAALLGRQEPATGIDVTGTDVRHVQETGTCSDGLARFHGEHAHPLPPEARKGTLRADWPVMATGPCYRGKVVAATW